MIEIIAASFEEGWAFFKQKNQFFVIKPPYQQDDRTEVTEAIAETAILQHGFTRVQIPVKNQRELIKRLKQEIVETNASEELVPQKELFQRMVKVAPMNVLEDYVKRTQKELMVQGKWQIALEILEAIQSIKKTQENPTFLKNVNGLIIQCKARLKPDQQRPIQEKYPNAAQKHGTDHLMGLMALIKNQQCQFG